MPILTAGDLLMSRTWMALALITMLAVNSLADEPDHPAVRIMYLGMRDATVGPTGELTAIAIQN